MHGNIYLIDDQVLSEFVIDCKDDVTVSAGVLPFPPPHAQFLSRIPPGEPQHVLRKRRCIGRRVRPDIALDLALDDEDRQPALAGQDAGHQAEFLRRKRLGLQDRLQHDAVADTRPSHPLKASGVGVEPRPKFLSRTQSVGERVQQQPHR